MRKMRALFLRLVYLFNKERRERDLAEEIESHLQMHIADNVRAGLDPSAARREALVKLGGVAATKERYRDRDGFPLIDSLWRDLIYAVRILRRNPAFTAIAVLTLGLGIGANTAIFSIVNAVLLRPLAYPNPGRLVMVWGTDKRRGDMEDVASYPNFEDWKSQSTVFESMAAFTRPGAVLSGAGDAEDVASIQVSPGFFETLGEPLQLGRTFTEDENQAGAPKVALIGYDLWKTRFGGKTDVLGHTLRINEETYSIIGVMRPGFSISSSAQEVEQVCTPLTRDPDRGHGFLNVIGRLKPKISISQAQAEMNAITSRLSQQYPGLNKGIGANIQSLVDATVGDVRTGLWILLGVVVVVLLIACANVASLMLSRGAARQREIAVRAALGAGRARLAQQLLVESTILALAGGALGLLMATFGAHLLVILLSKNFEIPRLEAAGIDGWVLAFTLAISILTGLAFGVFPALSAISRDLNATLVEAGRAATQGIRGQRVRNAFVILEMALALVLLTGAAALLKSFLVMRNTPPGFQAANLAGVSFTLPRLKYAELPARQAFYDGVLSSVRPLPGLSSAALVADLPFGGGSDGQEFFIPGRPAPNPRKGFSSTFNIASAGYFETMGIPLLAGREFTEQDSATTPGVIVINQKAAGSFWPGENPIGKQILLPGSAKTVATLTVVGVTADVRQSNLTRQPKPEIFLNYNQANLAWPFVTLVVRTSSNPAAMLGPLRTMAQSVDRNVPVYRGATMDELLSRSIAAHRTYTLLLGIFAMLALVLAAVGIYGLVSYSVAQRTHEIGIRMALGAERQKILRMMLRQGLTLAIAGTLIGLAGGIAATRVLAHLTPGVIPGDWITLAATPAILLAVSVAAILAPARRATRVEPNIALRCE
ncbi:MAG TPA: ABC transporter permease [Blastocatellia bacterium]|nr:ABC transporter permease [Blastocatellia bacterium]